MYWRLNLGPYTCWACVPVLSCIPSLGSNEPTPRILFIYLETESYSEPLAGLELKEICQPLPQAPSAEIKGMCHHVWLLPLIIIVSNISNRNIYCFLVSFSASSNSFISLTLL